MNWRRQAIAAAAALAIALPLLAPQVLAFPHAARVNGHRVYAEMPITPALVAAVQEADRKVAQGPLAGARPSDQDLFLTTGGWRWYWLSLGAPGALGVTRAISEKPVLNRTDGRTAMVRTGLPVGGVRPLDEVIAHEMTHGSIRSHFGRLTDFTHDRLLLEGLGDYVAQGSTLTDAEAQGMLARGEDHPALVYWLGRERIEWLMAQPGMGVDRLFVQWDKAAAGTGAR